MKSILRRILILILALSPTAFAEDIDGVQPAALDQPRVNIVIRRKPHGKPLIGASADGGQAFNVEAFLDTGASGIVISDNTAKMLGVQRELAPGHTYQAEFEDVGVGGGSAFAISEPVYISIAPMSPNVDVDDAGNIDLTYPLTTGPFCTQVGPLSSGTDWLTSLALGDMDIVGMPAMKDTIVVMDPRDVDAMTDKIRTFVFDAKYAATTRPSPIPQTHRHVKLSYVSFTSFTQMNPPAATRPSMTANPMIGPDPLGKSSALANAAPPLVVWHHGKTASGTWLLDTGAAASMISVKEAAALGVTYAPDNGGNPRLLGVPADKQFTMSIGGIGGTKKSAGFFIDKLILPTQEGTPITYLHAPVLVADISMEDINHKKFTLDGVFGMNFLVASAMVDEGGLVPDIGKITAGPYQWIVVDHSAALLGLELKPSGNPGH